MTNINTILKQSGRKKLRKPNILEKKNSRQRHTIGLTTFFASSKNILKLISYGSLKLAGFEGMNLSQTAEKKNRYFLIELIEIYLPVPIVSFSIEKNEAPSPKYCSCKILLYQGIFENLDFWRFGPMILCSCFWRFRWKTLENHRSKQMTVYKQITFFIKNQKF